MKLFLLVAFVILFAGTVCYFLIDAATIQPIERRLPDPPAPVHPSQTNAVPSTSTNGTVLSVVTNAEYYIEADVQKSEDLAVWFEVKHLGILLPEEDGASGSDSFSDGEVSGTLTASLTSQPGGPVPALALNRPRWQVPRPPPHMFYRVVNFNAWRSEYYTVLVSAGAP